ncbi:hypothetical protein [Moraxella catarrhalis]|uniref:hypothetical protein n=1 Tax=Moraxella catarrhalis TaxID=480 RepID=UPI0011C3C369|nr:hypothetical protein [Moraxella catarrhalis]
MSKRPTAPCVLLVAKPAFDRHGIYPKISWKIDANSRAYIAKKQMLSYLYGEHDAIILATRQKHCVFTQDIKIYGE